MERPGPVRHTAPQLEPEWLWRSMQPRILAGFETSPRSRGLGHLSRPRAYGLSVPFDDHPYDWVGGSSMILTVAEQLVRDQVWVAGPPGSGSRRRSAASLYPTGRVPLAVALGCRLNPDRDSACRG